MRLGQPTITDPRGPVTSVVVPDVTERARDDAALQFLAEASALLSSSLDYEDTLTRVARLVVPRLADWCAVQIVEPSQGVRSLVVAHVDPAKVAQARDFQERYPTDPNAPRGLHQVLRTGRSEIYPEISDAMLVAGARDPEHVRLVRALGFVSAMIVPLVARENVLGAITFVAAESGRHFGPADLVLAEDLARRAALAVDNARLYREAQDALAQARAARDEVRALNTALERRVRERTAQLEAANRELEAFSYSVAHDLRSPLRGIDGFSLALLEDYGDQLDAPGQDYLQRIRAASQRMGQLIDDLLGLSRISRQELQRAPVDLSAIARSIAAELRQRDPGRAAVFAIDDGIVVDGDPRLLRIVLENLLGNAWKFTGKRVTAEIGFGATRDHGEPVYVVRDNGAGFDMAHATRLFVPFQRLHQRAEFDGTGIGLALVQRIIGRHGGEVWAEAAVDRGATIYFTLGGDP